jgi:hypothetical protein
MNMTADRLQVQPAPAPRPAPAPSRRPAPRREHLRVVAPDERTRRRLTPAAGVVLTALLFVVLFALAGAHSLLVQGQIRLDDLDAQLTTEQARYQQLRKDVAEKESPERIVAAAHERGMVTPEDLVYLQPPASDADPGDADVELTRQASGSWTTVKPLLEAPAP